MRQHNRCWHSHLLICIAIDRNQKAQAERTRITLATCVDQADQAQIKKGRARLAASSDSWDQAEDQGTVIGWRDNGGISCEVHNIMRIQPPFCHSALLRGANDVTSL
jgi:hypothetical protein